MKEEYGVVPGPEHYACVVDMLGRRGRLKEAMKVAESMPFEAGALVWEALFGACRVDGDMVIGQRAAERLAVLEPKWVLPYLVMAQVRAMNCRWERVACVRNAMQEKRVKKVTGCSWIGIREKVIVKKKLSTGSFFLLSLQALSSYSLCK
ncbi:hypothetical protein AMTR_s00014p00068560 [Amborella trichopoda]|uniref:Pentacotripeptide-repeat region of PRORP domain-containing protein n=2 Tax=Amborella trichopoda TaxID=13333 RepID=W1PM03_AMBTC|nr:hypothetical protein AMTR_s00014p00068560 [Amborella trichopoda]